MSPRIALVPLIASLAACAYTSHEVKPSTLGVSRRAADLLAVIDVAGPLEVETVNSADWAVPLSGLLNLEHPEAKKAGLTDHDEPIQVFFHVIRHPSKGTFIIDTGMERALRDAPEKAAIQGIAASFMHLEKLKVHVPLADWIAKEPKPLAGVFMTHLHLDHVSGMPDVPHGTPIFNGPNETGVHEFQNLVLQGNIDRAFAGQDPISEWQYAADADQRFSGLIDVFGDGSFWAISTPGHTPGASAYLARTTKGPVLFVGDTSHTVWGWEHHVEPGGFTADHAANIESLERLHRLVDEHPAIDVRLGHQSVPAKAVAAPAGEPVR